MDEPGAERVEGVKVMDPDELRDALVKLQEDGVVWARCEEHARLIALASGRSTLMRPEDRGWWKVMLIEHLPGRPGY